MTNFRNSTQTEDVLDGTERDALSASTIVEAPTTLTGLGPVEEPPELELDAEPATLDGLAETLSIRSRKAPAPLPPRATRDYQPPTLLIPPPGSTSPAEPSALRSVWIKPEVTEVKPRSAPSDYAPAVARTGRPSQGGKPLRSESRTGQSDAPWSTNPSDEPSRSGTSLRTPLLAFVASVVATVALLAFVLMPKAGRLLVTAAGPGNAPIVSVGVLVDGREACTSVPCRVDGLSRGSHLVRVHALGYVSTADQAVAVRTGEDTVLHVNLANRDSASIDVRAAAAPGLRVSLDGSDRGPAPLTLRDLKAGPHTLRLAGSPRYAPFEQQIRLEPEQTVSVEPKLVPLVAVINVAAGRASLGARVEIIGGDLHQDLRNFPARLEVSPDATYLVRATRLGYLDYQTEVAFSDGALQRDVVIDLVWNAASGVKPEGLATSSLAPSPSSATSGTIGANSIPISNVLVDGRPAGPTPARIAVAPGQHSVVFVHPSLGRKSLNVVVSPGKSSVAAVRF